MACNQVTLIENGSTHAIPFYLNFATGTATNVVATFTVSAGLTLDSITAVDQTAMTVGSQTDTDEYTIASIPNTQTTTYTANVTVTDDSDVSALNVQFVVVSDETDSNPVNNTITKNLCDLFNTMNPEWWYEEKLSLNDTNVVPELTTVFLDGLAPTEAEVLTWAQANLTALQLQNGTKLLYDPTYYWYEYTYDFTDFMAANTDTDTVDINIGGTAYAKVDSIHSGGSYNSLEAGQFGAHIRDSLTTEGFPNVRIHNGESVGISSEAQSVSWSFDGGTGKVEYTITLRSLTNITAPTIIITTDTGTETIVGPTAVYTYNILFGNGQTPNLEDSEFAWTLNVDADGMTTSVLRDRPKNIKSLGWDRFYGGFSSGASDPGVEYLDIGENLVNVGWNIDRTNWTANGAYFWNTLIVGDNNTRDTFGGDNLLILGDGSATDGYLYNGIVSGYGVADQIGQGGYLENFIIVGDSSFGLSTDITMSALLALGYNNFDNVNSLTSTGYYNSIIGDYNFTNATSLQSITTTSIVGEYNFQIYGGTSVARTNITGWGNYDSATLTASINKTLIVGDNFLGGIATNLNSVTNIINVGDGNLPTLTHASATSIKNTLFLGDNIIAADSGSALSNIFALGDDALGSAFGGSGIGRDNIFAFGDNAGDNANSMNTAFMFGDNAADHGQSISQSFIFGDNAISTGTAARTVSNSFIFGQNALNNVLVSTIQNSIFIGGDGIGDWLTGGQTNKLGVGEVAGTSTFFLYGDYSGAATSNLTINGGLELVSTTKPLVPPRMTTAQKNAITEEGAIVYDTDLNKSYTYDGTTWQAHW